MNEKYFENFIVVTKEVFFDFVKNYPNKLECHATGICEPPMIAYYDFSLGCHSESMVARFKDDKENPAYQILNIKPGELLEKIR